jgi:hemerythrin-like metal-binding protein
MDFIIWNDTLSVGISKFDEEHKQLIGFINKLNQSLSIGGAQKSMEDILTGLINYAAIHFSHEEELMTQYNFPGYAGHKAEHDRFASQVSDFHDRYIAGRASFSLELLTFLREWLTGHIMKIDGGYREFFKSKGL